jgi:hypothetical protein
MATELTKQEQFFYDHAGYGYHKALETEDEGHTRSAKRLAIAETWAIDSGHYFDWVDDPEGCIGCMCGNDDCACFRTGGKPTEDHHPKGFIMRWDNDDNVVKRSLWGICGADAAYRRVIEAELALEEIPESEMPADIRFIID